jgi:hypothetical protein
VLEPVDDGEFQRTQVGERAGDASQQEGVDAGEMRERERAKRGNGEMERREDRDEAVVLRLEAVAAKVDGEALQVGEGREDGGVPRARLAEHDRNRAKFPVNAHTCTN